jgi:excisionase family DNA binding protein
MVTVVSTPVHQEIRGLAMTADEVTPATADDVLAEGALGVPDAVNFTGMSRSDLYDRMTRGELPYTKVGRRRLIPRRALVEMLRKNLVGVGTA